MNYNSQKEVLRKLIEKRNFFFKNTTEREAKLYLNSKTDFKGLSEIEITRIENTLGKKIPLEFKNYLLEFGKNCGELFCCGQDLEVEKIIKYQNWAKELIEENKIQNFLNEDTLVFSFHQGYVFQYLKKEDNQFKVYEYMEGDEKPVKRFNSFNEMLKINIQNMFEINAESEKSNGHFLTIINGKTQAIWPVKNSGIIPREVGDVFVKEKRKIFNLFRKKD